MLVLVIPVTYTSVLFASNLRLHIIPAVIRIEGVNKSNTFWLASGLVETEAGHGKGCCMPCHLN